MWQLTLRVLGGRASAPSRPDCHRSCLLPLLYNSWQFQFHQESCRERKLPHEPPSTAETLLVTTVVTACFHLSSVLYLGHSSRASQHSESHTGGHGGCWWWWWGDRQEEEGLQGQAWGIFPPGGDAEAQGQGGFLKRAQEAFPQAPASCALASAQPPTAYRPLPLGRHCSPVGSFTTCSF